MGDCSALRDSELDALYRDADDDSEDNLQGADDQLIERHDRQQ